MSKVVIAGGNNNEVNYSKYSNPTFDSRIYRQIYPDIVGNQKVGTGLSKGQLFNTDSVTTTDQFTVNFLYNPTELVVNHSIDTDIPDPKAMSTDDKGIAMGPLNQELDFSLLFDRTYETWDSQYAESAIARFGVYLDVQAFYNLVGITSPVTLVPGGGGVVGSATNTNAPRDPVTFTPSGPMRMTPIRALFNPLETSLLNFYGFISAMEITYTHFTALMVPNRVGISLSMQLMIDTDASPSSAANASTAAASKGPGGVSTQAQLSSTSRSQIPSYNLTNSKGGNAGGFAGHP
jgi:hypothetical protein